jgi:hypothetical protein
MQIEIHTAELLVHDPRPSEVETAIIRFKKYKPPHSDHILEDLIQAEGEKIQSGIHKLNGIRKSSVMAPVHKNSNRTVVIIVGYHCYQLHTKFRAISFSQGPYTHKITGDHWCGF